MPRDDTHVPKLKILDLFSGIGGLSLGLEQTNGFETVAFCEPDPYACRVLARHWPHVPIYGDVRRLGVADLVRDGVPYPDIICGGFPCTDISAAGRGAGLGGKNSGLWYEMLRIVGECCDVARAEGAPPPWVLIENVPVLRSRGLEVVLGGLMEVGLDAEWNLIPASAVGAPHRRDRIWIVAYPARDELAYPRGPGRPRPGQAQPEEWRGDPVPPGAGPAVADALGGGRDRVAYRAAGHDSDGAETGRQEGPDRPQHGGQDGPGEAVADATSQQWQRGQAGPWGAGRSEPADGCGDGRDVADADLDPRLQRWSGHPDQGPRGRDADRGVECANRLRDAYGTRLAQRQGVGGYALPERPATVGAGGRPPEPWIRGVDDAVPQGLDGGRLDIRLRPDLDWWASEWPDTPRIATGVKNRIDRLRCLGNSVVPQIPFLLGEAVLRAKGLRD